MEVVPGDGTELGSGLPGAGLPEGGGSRCAGRERAGTWPEVRWERGELALAAAPGAEGRGAVHARAAGGAASLRGCPRGSEEERGHASPRGKRETREPGR